MQTFNWYPGHMKKTRELIAENLKLVDAVVEVCDARIPVSSRNPILSELTAGKTRVLVMNKSDLADEAATSAWLDYFRRYEMKDMRTALALDSMKPAAASVLTNRLGKLETRRGVLRIMVIGIPNSGKSTLINRLTGRRSAATGNRPGVTRGKQWITLENGMQLLDTPGILWPKFEDQTVGLHLAFCGSIPEGIMDTEELGLELIRFLAGEYPEMIAPRYGVDMSELPDGDARETGGALALMEAIARKRGFLLPGKKIDYERTARTVLDEFRSGKLGRVTIERAPEAGSGHGSDEG
ncbi:MAG: ribosome biogenesis GTPase YlqF [Clostridiales Family XIII bacterium]|jgi:ribosome biogenesis GTPase A|nr:ribosome biogenesis GTPase YlqF [Clostridiales Family XIII bacterium]